jgi:hypothetical protein
MILHGKDAIEDNTVLDEDAVEDDTVPGKETIEDDTVPEKMLKRMILYLAKML